MVKELVHDPLFLAMLSAEATKEDIPAAKDLLETLKAFDVEIVKKRPVSEAIITSGGVKTGEIDPRTMQSKKVPGLYFAGEIIDCDAYTGGFNLQIAWATGHGAGLAASESNP